MGATNTPKPPKSSSGTSGHLSNGFFLRCYTPFQNRSTKIRWMSPPTATSIHPSIHPSVRPSVRPSASIHLSPQPSVRSSFASPLGNWIKATPVVKISSAHHLVLPSAWWAETQEGRKAQKGVEGFFPLEKGKEQDWESSGGPIPKISGKSMKILSHSVPQVCMNLCCILSTRSAQF